MAAGFFFFHDQIFLQASLNTAENQRTKSTHKCTHCTCTKLTFQGLYVHFRGWQPVWVVWLDDGGKKARGSVGQWVKRWEVKRVQRVLKQWACGYRVRWVFGSWAECQAGRHLGGLTVDQMGQRRHNTEREDVQSARMEIHTGGFLRAIWATQ